MQVRDSNTGQWVEVVKVLGGGGSGDSVDTSDLAKESTLDFAATSLEDIAQNTIGLAKYDVQVDTYNELASHTSNLSNIDNNVSPNTRTPTFQKVTDAGTFSGYIEITISNTGDTDGTVLGTTLRIDETVKLGNGAHRDVLSDVSYDATGTEFTIVGLK